MYVAGQIELLGVGTTVATSDEIIYSDRAGGRFQVPAGSGITEITWYDAIRPGDVYAAACDASSDDLVQAVEAGKSYEIPPCLAGAQALKAVASGGNAGTLAVSLKG